MSDKEGTAWLIAICLAAYVFWPADWWPYNTLEKQYAKVDNLFKHRVGYSSDYGLFKQGFAGKEKIAVVYGFTEDFKACAKFAEALNSEDFSRPFVCEPLN